MSTATRFRVSIDVGGTFTDLYLVDSEGRSRSVKTPTTPDDLTRGVFDAITKAAEAYDLRVETFLERTDRLSHGTTVATNAIIEDETAPTALITTEGFRDVLTIREEGKDDPYDWSRDYPEPYVPRRLTFGVEERINAEGDVVTPLDEEACRATIDEIASSDVEAVAVSLLWGHKNPVHEQRIGQLIESQGTDLRYSLGSEVCPIVREHRRASATAINASLFTIVSAYLTDLREKLEANGYRDTPLIITANGGVMPIREVEETPIWMVDAGPTMFPVAAQKVTRMALDVDDVIALDMGGTSLDMGVVTGGSVPRSRDATVGDEYVLGIEKAAIKSIGSGGGSVAWVDDGGLLRVGPESAGAAPGPACYGRGGERPTVTDAVLVLGYLDEEYFLGGEMNIDAKAAERALRSIADPLGVEVIEAARAVYATANQNMVNGIKGVTIERGIDPREFVLSGGGGALGTHVVPIARELRVEDIILPAEAGVVSSVGGLSSSIRRDISESHFVESHRLDRETINGILKDLESEAESFLERAEVPREQRSLRFAAEGRYPQQVWELEVELPASSLEPGDERVLIERFHGVHDAVYGFDMPGQHVEFLNWRCEAVGAIGGSSWPSPGDTEEEVRRGERDAYFGDSVVTCPAYRAPALDSHETIDGPAFIDAPTMTVVLPPESTLSVTPGGHYHIQP